MAMFTKDLAILLNKTKGVFDGMYRLQVLEEQTSIPQPGKTRNVPANHASLLRYIWLICCLLVG